MEETYSEDSLGEIAVNDAPGMEIQDMTGEYLVSTVRIDDGKSAIPRYLTRILRRIHDESIAFGLSERLETLIERTNYKLDIALSVHDSWLSYLSSELNPSLKSAA